MAERYYQAEGLVIKTRPLGEADRVVTLLTKEKGKFEAVARGARKTKSKLAAGVDLFAHGVFSFHRGRTWPVVTGIAPARQFNWFRHNPELYPYGLYFAELINCFVAGEEACCELYYLLLEGWELLGGSVDCELLCRAFELKLAAGGGYCPELNCCTACGAKDDLFFSPKEGGLICSRCRKKGALKLLPGTIALARRLLFHPLAGVANIKAGPLLKKELLSLSTSFYAQHLNLPELKTRRLL